MKIKRWYLPYSSSKRPMIKKPQKGVVIHSTANTAPAINEAKNLHRKSNTRVASFNTVIDDKEIIEVIPHDEITYNAGNREGNWHYISIEMCEGDNRKKVIENTAKYTTKILKERNWGIQHLRRHYDFPRSTNGWRKPCPRILMYNNWEGWAMFKTMVAIELKGGLSSMTEKEVRKIVREEIRPSINGGSPDAHWAYKDYTFMNREIENFMYQRRFDDLITRGEALTMMTDLYKELQKQIKEVK